MTKKIRFIAIAVIAILLVLLVWFVLNLNSKIIQPISYNHKVHIEEAGLECQDCHVYVETMPSATIPGIEVCSECHEDEPMTDSPEELKVIKHIKDGKEIEWKRIYELPDHVYFSHRRHVVLGELECATCHGNVESLTEPDSWPFRELSMDNCMDCHKEHNVTTDCLACHR